MGIAFDEKENAILFRFTDQGIPFDPLAKPDPDVTLNAKEREIGGLGIYMMKKMMDEVSYSYEHGHNILTMKKKL
ncbi:MAG: ATP-binding protein [Suilimivivens sp.]